MTTSDCFSDRLRVAKEYAAIVRVYRRWLDLYFGIALKQFMAL